ncbi:MAG: glutamyl-tRNA reductase [Candidatus Eremiobacteraeota bacterium]|nr:glutamyl-tRNA reductase [Candidatus Eremiobacteraeota bacterium]
MPIVVLGLSHRTAPPDVRSQHAFPLERVTEALGALRDYGAVREAAIVSTCNRLEIYADVVDFEVGVAELKEFLTTYRNMRVEDFDKYLYTMLGAQAVEQLFKVASGLDSMLLGETEIIGQVRAAFLAAARAGTVGPQLNRLFTAAIHTGKRARTETCIGRDVVSFGAAAVELASRHCDVERADALVLGCGKMGGIVARHLRARGARSIAVANRTAARAERLASEVAGRALPLSSVADALKAVDLVISAIGCGSYAVGEAMLRKARKGVPSRPLLFVDLGVPRDIDPNVSRVADVRVYELADLRHVIDESLDGRRKAIPAVEVIIESAVREYMCWFQSRAAVPLIASLRRKAEQIRVAEIEKLLSRLPRLNERERDCIVAASIAIINRFLHTPVTRLRETAAETAGRASEQQTLERLFDLADLGQQLERQLGAQMTLPRPDRTSR